MQLLSLANAVICVCSVQMTLPVAPLQSPCSTLTFRKPFVVACIPLVQS